ncbi:MAG: cytochrome c oxidase subunit 3 [Betaproteobacteria bacterium]|jgi:cytochrome c oxidase subunit 3|nr:cytochrome c oxidase subunit 3 [Betaproteobacteria bacterium]MDH5285923.1 cytochrome c oxidase subunit 3 [Betaproteobacteria bacterium]
MSASTHGGTPAYYVPQPSHWPIVGSVALLLMGMGAAFWMNDIGAGPWMVAAGFVALLVMLFGWFGTVVGESEGHLYSNRVDLSFRWSMGWFIFSEVMFFAAFFGALFYTRALAVPDLGSAEQKLLWPDFAATWPTAGPYIQEKFSPIGAFGIPLLNTILLLTSGVTLTIAHHALKVGNRGGLKLWLFLTIVLGVTFLGFQAYEYVHLYRDLNLKLSTGIYGSTFFMLTGFHGAHVTVGAIMLTVMLFRAFRGHFTPDHHFAFEAAAWYWHFVDVVWLLLFVLVYWM